LCLFNRLKYAQHVTSSFLNASESIECKTNEFLNEAQAAVISVSEADFKYIFINQTIPSGEIAIFLTEIMYAKKACKSDASTFKNRRVHKSVAEYAFCPCGPSKTKLSLDHKKNSESWICRKHTFHWAGPCCNIDGRCKYHNREQLIYTGELWAATTSANIKNLFWQSAVSGYVPKSTSYDQYIQTHKQNKTYETLLTEKYQSHSKLYCIENKITIKTGLPQTILLTHTKMMGIWELTLSKNGHPIEMKTLMFIPPKQGQYMYTFNAYITPTMCINHNWINNTYTPLHLQTKKFIVNNLCSNTRNLSFPHGCVLSASLSLLCIIVHKP